MERQCMKEIETEITVSADSKTKEGAVGKAFQSLRSEAAKQIDGIIVYMRPLDVTLEEMKISTSTEKFLFFFLPRKRQTVFIKLRIKALVDYLTLEGD
ncbi:DUF4312 family protein [Caproiciproducens sp.]